MLPVLALGSGVAIQTWQRAVPSLTDHAPWQQRSQEAQALRPEAMVVHRAGRQEEGLPVPMA
jgi:hypothetical protein